VATVNWPSPSMYSLKSVLDVDIGRSKVRGGSLFEQVACLVNPGLGAEIVTTP
jgi:hypothetical protein